jgi:hypothetical protein
MSIVGLFTHPARDWAGKYGTSVIAWIWMICYKLHTDALQHEGVDVP